MCTLGVILAHRVLEYQKWCPSVLDARGNRVNRYSVASLVFTDNYAHMFSKCKVNNQHCQTEDELVGRRTTQKTRKAGHSFGVVI